MPEVVSTIPKVAPRFRECFGIPRIAPRVALSRFRACYEIRVVLRLLILVI